MARKISIEKDSTESIEANIPKGNALKDLESYDTKCERLSDQNARILIENLDDDKSQITSSHLFRNTKEGGVLYIYSHGFRKNLTEDRFDYLKNLETCLKNCSEAKIIVDVVYDSNVVLMISRVAAKNKKIKLYRAKDVVKDYLKVKLAKIQKNENLEPFIMADPHYHFTISDNFRYRLEYNPDQKIAKVFYNDPKEAKDLSDLFLSLTQDTNLTEEIELVP